MSELPHTPQSLRVGCIGGGQLGRMLALEAPRLNISMSFLDPLGQNSPAAAVTGANSVIIQGDLTDQHKIRELASVCDIITCEIEHIGTDVLEELEMAGVNVQPSGRVVKIIQDKLTQKQHFQQSDIPVPPFLEVSSITQLYEVASKLGLPLMLKSRRGGYDGRGNAVLRDLSETSISLAMKSLGVLYHDESSKLDLYAEGWVHFHSEVAVIVVRSTSGETRAYPAVTAIQTDSICRLVISPARNLSSHVRTLCEETASKAIESLGKGATGVFGVELFVVIDSTSGESTVLLNEVAPRPHNTGHYTQDACAVSQFENHLRAICGLPLGSTSMSVGAAAMVNILGAHSGSFGDTMIGVNKALRFPRTTVHWYGKDGCRAGRKMGHVNITADTTEELDSTISILLSTENVSEKIIPPVPSSCKIDVGVIMGSHSDLPTMQEAVLVLREFGISYEVDVVSAHRTPDKLVSYGRSAVSRGLKVIIAGAGGAAHLPGMIAALTPLPVVGVPIKTSTLNGQDSLLSIVQMPKGVPVATVAIGNAANAGLLAVRILGCNNPELLRKMESYQAKMDAMVQSTSEKLIQMGSDKYLEQMEK